MEVLAEAVEVLRQLGLGEAEARLYIALLAQPGLTGYHAARAAGVPRPNAYPALDRLEGRGAVVRLADGSGAVRYAALPYEEFCARLQAEFERRLAAARAALAELPRREPEGGVPLVASGRDNLVAMVRALCAAARRSVKVATARPESAEVGRAARPAARRGVDVLTLCLDACRVPCGECVGRVVRPEGARARPGGTERWVLCLRDGEELLVGEVEGSEVRVTRTRQRPFLAAAAALFRGTVALEPAGPDGPGGARVE